MSDNVLGLLCGKFQSSAKSYDWMFERLQARVRSWSVNRPPWEAARATKDRMFPSLQASRIACALGELEARPGSALGDVAGTEWELEQCAGVISSSMAKVKLCGAFKQTRLSTRGDVVHILCELCSGSSSGICNLTGGV